MQATEINFEIALNASQEKSKGVWLSQLMTYVYKFLGHRNSLQLQQLNKFFYARGVSRIQVRLPVQSLSYFVPHLRHSGLDPSN